MPEVLLWFASGHAPSAPIRRRAVTGIRLPSQLRIVSRSSFATGRPTMQQTSGSRSPSLAMLTDLYQLTMAEAYWRQGLAERPAAFHHKFRHAPFHGGFTIAAGLGPLIEIIENFRFEADDLDYLSSLRSAGNQPLFAADFLQVLGKLRLRLDLDGVPEGTVVFPHEPLVRVEGPIMHCQLLETALLNILNFQTLIATKSARVCLAAAGTSVLEFGLRRAQGPDGGVLATRAAYVGGCHATSNVLAGQRYGIPVRGTHAHSWVMAFDNERESFRAYAAAMPDNCVFLVDTYDTLHGVENAIAVGHELKQRGVKLRGVRLDSGDLASLSIAARRRLDEEGFADAQIIASGDLDEYVIAECRQRGARIDVWGVGTRLAVAYEQPALGGVYKLAALHDEEGRWQMKLKISDDPVKSSTPGRHQVRRFSTAEGFVGDLIYELDLGASPHRAGHSRNDPGRRITFPASADYQDLLVPIYRSGHLVYDVPSLDESRARSNQQLGQLPQGCQQLRMPADYNVALDERLQRRKEALVAEVRQQA